MIKLFVMLYHEVDECWELACSKPLEVDTSFSVCLLETSLNLWLSIYLRLVGPYCNLALFYIEMMMTKQLYHFTFFVSMKYALLMQIWFSFEPSILFPDYLSYSFIYKYYKYYIVLNICARIHFLLIICHCIIQLPTP